ncbi:MAG: aminotransferase class I/II-fold pyridoxal phosphate-dependent enzyme [Candidatus Omnitrophica bacterium]|nr:aminotransferase class I/II-fold pyridoxal phosphate-dependent enzyme [Candidatus Omnitrophota bacterium]
MGIISFKISQTRIEFSFKALAVFLKAFYSDKKKKKNLIEEFEKAFAKYVGVKNSISVSSGKIALWLSLRGLNAIKGDEIIVPAYTVPEVIEVILLCGLRPIFVDICFNDATMDIALVEEKITSRTKFVLATHMYGNPCQIDKILDIAKKHNLKVIEDAAQACGAEFRGKKTGSFGEIGYFSFGLTKNFNTLGGGMIVTDDDELAFTIRKKIELFRPIPAWLLLKRLLTVLLLWICTYPVVFSLCIYPLLYLGLRRWENKLCAMFKVRQLTEAGLNEIKQKFSAEQAALGLVQIRTLNTVNDEKIKKAFLFNRRLSRINGIRIFEERKDVKNIYLNYVIRVEKRKLLMDYLFLQGVYVLPGFVIDCSHQFIFEEFNTECPNSRKLENENLYLPLNSALSGENILYIAELIERYYAMDQFKGQLV